MQASLGEHLDHIVDFLLVMGPFSYWLYRSIRRIETTVGATKSIVNKHLPFIYERQKVYDAALNLPHPDHPDIPPINGTS